ncbi:bifunctional folylpolyglutamate synthase/dihydrofolate synthase [endosymbiont GvMRE of Glomus versiforme]|uniref:bifunctional folylpolyglutamate synthase/dihydrofolate synthase n=1 Tax=endosymbiont GvMRE of Glomus versiforme TaxID=2039283 RepID=UPI000EEE2187|nr:folylpolyglutamate synthase/dihydrofolate synthase family protein [endosymbiont GvMRE of Glomus versiforme]RHZ37690.1 Folylpolyglutamate synthase [endosymbiont GvMRE of Glomus versiforme]
MNFFPNFANINECLEWVKRKDLALAKMELICQLLNHPEKKQKTIHIAGTNGKGSTVAFLTSIFQNSGLQVGTFTSPHLDDWNERIKVNGISITNHEFFLISQQIMSELEGKVQPTIFEFLTAVALYYFAEIKPVDLVIYEVGVGGKYDATNVISPLVCGITNIDYDHLNYLGNTLTDIAQKKAGIIKKDIPCFTTETKPQILSLLQKISQEKQSKLCKISPAKKFIFDSSQLITNFCLTAKKHTFNLKTKMLGQHQIKNASLAVNMVLYLQKYFPQITQSSIEKGIKEAFWPSRMELISQEPLIFLDGAHNLGGIKSLIQTLKTFFPAKKPIFLISIMKDKQVDKILNTLKKIACQIIFTEIPETRRQEISKLKHNNTAKFHKITDYSKAFFSFYSLLDNQKIGIICGSLHFTALIKREFLMNLNEKLNNFSLSNHQPV